jgi:hypothetical protein
MLFHKSFVYRRRHRRIEINEIHVASLKCRCGWHRTLLKGGLVVSQVLPNLDSKGRQESEEDSD